MADEIDYMEYATNAAAQAAYVTNDATNLQSYSEATIKTQGSYSLKGVAAADTVLLDEDMADISDWTDGDLGTGESSQVTFDSKSCMKLDSGAKSGVADVAIRFKLADDDFDTRTVISCSMYFDSIGTEANSDAIRLFASNGTTDLRISFGSDGLKINNGVAYNEVGTDLVVQDVWQKWTFDVDWTAQTVDVYLDDILKASDIDCSVAGGTSKQIYFAQWGDTTANRITYIDYVTVSTPVSFGKTLTRTFS